MLQETTLFGWEDKVEKAMERLKLFSEKATENHENGFQVCDSGGKDSTVIKYLALMSGVTFEITHNFTTLDYPETVRFIKSEQQFWEEKGVEYTINYPMEKEKRTSMWKLIEKHGAPTHQRRWCCEKLKEHSGKNRVVVTGVRWSESARRKNSRSAYEIGEYKKDMVQFNNDNDARRKMTEYCIKKGKVVVNPIIDWTDEDIWEFIHKIQAPYNPLYDQGFKRIGCIGCPMKGAKALKAELNSMPKYRDMYIRSFQKYIEAHPKPVGNPFTSGQAVYDWWVGDLVAKKEDTEQITLWENE